MLMTKQRDVNRLLMVLATFLMVIAVLVGPADAHERLRWHHELSYPYAERDPSNPRIGTSGVGYRSVTGDVRSYRPVEPLPWGGNNNGAAPAQGPKKSPAPEHKEHK
jgi:hypothetical protein